MRQLVGLPCTVCGKEIWALYEGGFCPACSCPVHNACARPGVQQAEFCSTCGTNLAWVREEAHRQRRLTEAEAAERAEQERYEARAGQRSKGPTGSFLPSG